MKLNAEDLKPVSPPGHSKVNKCCASCRYLRNALESYRKIPLPDILECSIYNHTMKKDITLISVCKDHGFIQ